MLLTTGFNALPILWASGKYSLRGKVIWTITVALLAAIFFTFLAKNWAILEGIARELLNKN
jgi:hypothetical protein